MNENKTISTLKKALFHAENYISSLEKSSVNATVEIETLKSRFDKNLGNKGIDSEKVIDELVSGTEGGLLASNSGRFFAWVIGGNFPSALAADWLTTTWDQNAALYACSPAASVIEEVTGKWIKDLLDLPQKSSFAFTTGCQMAHFTALASARYAVLKKYGWDINTDGLFGAPNLRIIVNQERHASVDRAVRYLGIGMKNITPIPTNQDESIDGEKFKKILKEESGPSIVVLNAADLNIGSFDDFSEIIPIAQSAGAWVHIDGAFGLFARASRSKKKYLEGVEKTDSWATDAHKWLNTPFDCGMAIIRDPEAHRAAISVSASYIAPENNARDQIDWNPEWSRKARSIPVYAALRELGKNGLESLIDRTCAYAKDIVTGIGKLKNVEVLWEPELNQGLVRFLDSREDASDKDHDKHTEAIIDSINKTGEAFFSGTTWKGKKAMRVSVINWRTNDSDVKRALSVIERILKEYK